MSKDDRTDAQKAAERQWESAQSDIARHDLEFDEKHGT
jgi:hypothetical protein